jgi:NAD-dependent SIR2 family protein deacetylase
MKAQFEYVWNVPSPRGAFDTDWICDRCHKQMASGDKTYVQFDQGALAHTYCEACAKEITDEDRSKTNPADHVSAQ